MHGTMKAYREHLAANESACESCLRAAARYEAQRQLDILQGRDRLVDKAPSIRRLQALMALGWTGPRLSRRLGRADNYVKVFIARTTQPTCRRVTAEEIEDLYELIGDRPGPSPSGAKRALNKGWRRPIDWEDIEAGVPFVERRMTQAERYSRFDEEEVEYALQYHDFTRFLSPLERSEIVRRWVASGRSEASLCRLTGWREGRYRTPRPQEAA